MNGSFYTCVLVTGPRAACQAAGGHLARLMQTPSRGLRGTCCPSGGGKAWNETTPQQVTVQHDSVSKCADDNGQMWLVALNKWACESLSPTDKTPDWDEKGCSVSVRYRSRCTYRYLSLVESVTQLLCDCLTDLTYTSVGTTSAAPVGVGKPDAEFEKGTGHWTPSQQLPKKCVCLTKTLLSHSQASLDAS